MVRTQQDIEAELDRKNRSQASSDLARLFQFICARRLAGGGTFSFRVSIPHLFMLLFWCVVVGGAGSLQADDVRFNLTPTPQARVVIVENAKATMAFEPQPDVVRTMVDSGITQLAGKTNVGEAWRTFVSTNDVVGLKVLSAPGPHSGTRPAVVAAVIEGLLKSGLTPSNIVIWDRQLVDLRVSGFGKLAENYGVRLAGAMDAGYDANARYTNELLGDLVAGDYEFDTAGTKSSRYSHFSKLLTRQLTKIIPISPLLNHNLAGVCGNLYSLAMSSADNTIRFSPDASRLARAVPEMVAQPELGDRVAVCITDALIGQYEGQRQSLLHYSTELNQLWFSKDPVALDVLALQELDRERTVAKMDSVKQNMELFRNATDLWLGVSDTARIRLETAK
jgi:hypothetical protein